MNRLKKKREMSLSHKNLKKNKHENTCLQFLKTVWYWLKSTETSKKLQAYIKYDEV